ncbi:hypothetical protein [Legionella fairfieldensis]|uniref:hypothetical protein n=1 Tax=Legionella fairfieldensis TaxID=45064 RepID=UPI00048C577B|nr:hypothetical protein [Legionella fairfieldensis]
MNDTTTLLPHIKLRFNIDHPGIEECYAYGYESALAEVEEEENPYPPGTQEYEQWMEGWWDGFYGEKPLFELQSPAALPPIKNEAANDQSYHLIERFISNNFFANVLKITGAIAATAVVGYQVLELVA